MPEFRTLLDGYRRFRSDQYLAQRRRWESLATGQEPPVMVIGCCDSRVDPATIFDTEPGQAFILRNVANLVPPYEEGGGLHGASAAIEFAVLGLDVRHIVVLGHGACGGVAAALTGVDLGAPGHSFIDGWISILSEARDRVLERDEAEPPLGRQRALELEGVKVSLSNLRSFPYVAEREADGQLKLHGAWFSIAEGVLYVLDEKSGTFSAARETE
ncbi:MAG TPA: carbonic anhydrase [Allosphingosinicella sp.]|nr:carbonic anhydrase [Allosphingosinicella sp.]